MSLLGNRVLRTEDPKFLTAGGDYVGDVALAGAATAVFVRSTMAHAHITSIDTADALAMPGVLAVLTYDDLGLPEMPPPFGPGMWPEAMGRPLLARGTVRFVGEPVAVVVADTAYAAADAAEAVIVDYEPLPAVVTLENALTNEVLLFPEVGTNQASGIPTGMVADTSGCDVVVQQRMVNQRVAAAPIEPRTSAAYWDGDRLIHYASSQGSHIVLGALAQIYKLTPDKIRVITPDVGGGFGAKGVPSPEEVLVGELARRVGRPVRWSESRTENMTAMVHGRGQVQQVTIGGTRDGKVLAFGLEVLQEAGAYPALGTILPGGTFLMHCGVYEFPSTGFDSKSLVTNTTPVGAYRGAGRPEAAAAIERAIDLFAAEIGMDPIEVRHRNFIAPFMDGHTTRSGATYDCGRFADALDLVIDRSGYAALRADQAGRRATGDRKALGIGISCYVEVTAMGGGAGGITESGSVELQADGSIVAKTGSTPYGQGHETTWAMIISDATGVPMHKIRVLHGDTDVIPSSGLTGGSRSVQIAGSAMSDAATRLAANARAVAADLLEAAVGDVVLDTESGQFHVQGTPSKAVSWDAVATASAASGTLLFADNEFSQPAPSFPFGAHVAVVEVDLDTGLVTLVRHIAVDDCGTMINPLLVEGQVHGGLAQGAAQALLEEVRYDVDGNPQTSNFADYAIISATELPSFERVEMETPSPLNPLGAKGIGESGTIGATPAVHNAVIDALAHLGVRHIDMPCTPEKVWRALNTAAAH
jgi:carbon-monoxide dehydrogenase large subunit